jgi:hypothetical protein
VQCPVELAVAHSAEPVTDRETGRGRERGDPRKIGEGRLGAEAAPVGPGGEELAGDQGSDVYLAEEGGSDLPDERFELLLPARRSGFAGRCTAGP